MHCVKCTFQTVLVLIGWLMSARAQNFLSHYSITRVTPDDGLSQGSNYFRYEDSKGFMWITGNDALNRYDGSFVKVYNLSRYFINCPKLQQGYGFAEDENGTVYIGSVRGLYMYHRDKDRFSLQTIFPGGDATAMPFAFRKGKIWCFNRQYQIATYDVKTRNVEMVARLPLPTLPSVHVYDLEGNRFYYRWPFIDGQDNIWVVGKNKIIFYKPATGTTHPVPVQSPLPAAFQSCYYNNTSSDLYIGNTAGVIRFNTITGRQQSLATLGGNKIVNVESITEKNGIVAIKSDNGVLFTDTSFTQSHWIDNEFGKFIRYYSFGFDKADRFWFCDDGLGQVIYDFKQGLLPRFADQFGPFKNLWDRGVSRFAELPNGDVMTQANIVLDKDRRLLKPYADEGINHTETDNARSGAWYYNTEATGHAIIYFKGIDKKTSQEYAGYKGDSLGVIQHIKVLPGGEVLCAFSKGLYWLNDKTGNVTPVAGQPQGRNCFFINPLYNNRYAISYLNNTMWIAAYDGHQEIRFLQSILPGVQPFYMQADSVKRQYWAGANDGVYLLNENFEKIKVFNADNGLAGTYTYGLLMDDAGNTWCSHQRGLSSINTTTHKIINYTKEDGIQDWDFNNRAFLKAKDGTLFFGGVHGFNAFRPPLQQNNIYQPEVYVNELLINGHLFAPDTNANTISHLELKPGQNDVSIHVIIKDLLHGRGASIAYRLNGGKWDYQGNKSYINFNALEPGKYVLEIGVADRFSDAVSIQKVIHFSIAAPFYRAASFWALVSIVVTGFVFWLIMRRRYLQQQRLYRQQLALEEQRQKITADLHDDIGASLSSLQINSAVASQLINKDIGQAKNALTGIEEQSKSLAEKIGDFIWSMKPGKDEFMTLSSRIKTFAAEILSPLEMNYQVQIDKEADTTITDMTSRKNILLIVKEAINNAAKYSQATSLQVDLYIIHANILITITDNGIGINEKQRNGNGLHNMQRRAEELGGHCSISSETGKGTTVSVTIPLAHI